MSKPAFLLLHGAWHGAWCWHKIVTRLERGGHAVLTPDLPGCGPDQTSSAAVSLGDWTQAVCRIIAAQASPVVVVGHSRAGIVISQAAERLPQRVKRLVYLNAFLLRNGESAFQVLQADGTSPLLRHVALAEDGSRWVLDPRAGSAMFYGECSEEDASFALSRLGTEPAAPLRTAVEITEDNFGRVSRAYIACARDRAIPHALQQKMYAAMPCDHVRTIAADHSPFFSAPDELAAHLLALA